MCLKNWVILCLSLAAIAFAPARGAIGSNFTVAPSLKIEQRYDDNVYFRENMKKNDFVTTLSPKLDFDLVNKNASLDGSYHLNARYYSENDELDYISHIADLNAKMDFSSATTLTVGDSFVYTQDSLEIIDIMLLTVRTDIYSNDLVAKIDHRHDARTGVSLTLADRSVNYESPFLIDSRTDSVAIGLERGIDVNTTALASYEYKSHRFDQPGSGDEEKGTHTATIGVKEALSINLKILLSAGLVYAPGINGNIEWVAEAGFEKPLPAEGLVSLNYTRDVATPSGLAADISVRDRAQFNWAQSITNRTQFRSFIALTRHESSDNDIELSTYEIGAFGVWTLSRWFDAAIGVVRFQQFAADSTGSDLERDQVFVNLTYHAPEWRF